SGIGSSSKARSVSWPGALVGGVCGTDTRNEGTGIEGACDARREPSGKRRVAVTPFPTASLKFVASATSRKRPFAFDERPCWGKLAGSHADREPVAIERALTKERRWMGYERRLELRRRPRIR